MMTRNFVLSAAATATAALLATQVWAAEPTIKEVTVNTDYSSLKESNAQSYYPELSQDLLEAILERISLTDEVEGYVIDVNIQSVSLDGDTMLPDSAEFNQMEGVMSLQSPMTNANTESYPIKIKAHSAEAAVPEGYVGVAPSTDDFYNAMIAGFADVVAEELPERMRESGSK